MDYDKTRNYAGFGKNRFKNVSGLSVFISKGLLKEKVLIKKIIKAKKINELGKCSTILNKEFMIACKDGAILPLLIQREGKRVVSLDDFLRGFTFSIHDILNA